MKTKNNVQKAILRWTAVVVSFVLISFTVSAQDFWKKLLTNSSFNEIALAMVENSKKADSQMDTETENATFFYLAVESEANLELEDWMIDENNFETSSYILTEEIENDLTIENWMLNENLFQVKETGKSKL